MKKFVCKFPNRRTKSDVYCGTGIFRQEIQRALKGQNSKVLSVVDGKVNQLHRDTSLAGLFTGVPSFVFPSGERNKSERMLSRMLGWLQENKADRKSILIAIGGGVVTDIAGYAASCYMRGIRFVSVPTTLVGQVDAAIGGKTGINFGNTKNLVGSFYPPEIVIADQVFLETLSKRDVRDGLVEAMKIFVSFDRRFVEKYRSRIPELKELRNVGELIADAIALKVRVVNADPYETGVRQALNLGHTTGHAVEMLNHWSHGKSVAFGILVATTLSERHCGMPDSDARAIWSLITNLYNRFELGESTPKEIWERIQYDKKRSGKAINFVLLKTCGKHQVKSLDYEEFRRGLEVTIGNLSK
jgi:3-dehydroquinate synthase